MKTEPFENLKKSLAVKHQVINIVVAICYVFGMARMGMLVFTDAGDTARSCETFMCFSDILNALANFCLLSTIIVTIFLVIETCRKWAQRRLQ